MARIRICDLCGVELDRFKNKFFTLKRNYIYTTFEHGHAEPDPTFVKLDICEDCMKKILNGVKEALEEDYE